MPDILDQIQQRQARAQDQELAAAQNDYDWNATFGRMAPDNVLRGTRDMTALIANAVERKMALAAQTNAEAQRIYLADQRWKAEQRMQPLKDDRLIAQTRADVARQRAAAAKELLDFSRLERAETAIEHTSKAQWEMDQIEGATIPEADKRAWHNTLRGKYPFMDKDATARHGTLHAVLNPSDEKIRVAGEIAKVREAAKPPPKTDAERIAFEVDRKKALDAASKEAPEKFGTETTTTESADGKTTTRRTRQLPNPETLTVRPGGRVGASVGTTETAPPIVATTAGGFKPGDTRTKGGVTYVRGEDGIWLPQP